MSATDVHATDESPGATAKNVGLKLEVAVIPVSDVDRLKEFYGRLGWRLDPDFAFDTGVQVVQFTPPDSPAAIQFGAKMTSAAPGSAENLYLIVSDIEAAREEFVARGAEVSEVLHAGAPGAQFQPDGASDRLTGLDADHASYRSFATFSDPDGNRWLLQEITSRLPGRVDATQTTFASRARCGVPRPRTARTRGAQSSATRTGPTGTPSTSLRSRPAKTCRRDPPRDLRPSATESSDLRSSP